MRRDDSLWANLTGQDTPSLQRWRYQMDDLIRGRAPPVDRGYDPPSAAEYLNHPERYPYVTDRPMLPENPAMGQGAYQPRNPAMLMAAELAQPHLQAPLSDPTYAPTAPGIALRALVPNGPYMPDGPESFVPREERHGLEPPDAPAQPIIDDNAGALLMAMRQARHERMASNRAEFRRNQYAQRHAPYQSPLLRDIASIPHRIALAGQAEAIERQRRRNSRTGMMGQTGR